MKISLIIPTYNESKTILEVIEKSKKFVDEIIVIDNMSSDNTVDLAKEKGAIILINECKRNVSRSLEMGIAYSKGDVVVIIDGDMEIDPYDIPKILESYKKTKANFILGKRPKLPRKMERIISNFFKEFYGVEDVFCGLKLIERKVATKLIPFSKFPNFGLDFVYDAIKKGYKVTNIGITDMLRRDDARLGDMEAVERKMLFDFMDFLNRNQKTLMQK